MSNTESGSLRSEPSAFGPVTYGNAAVHRMRELYESGMELWEIGLQYNRNPSTVFRLLRGQGVQFRRAASGEELSAVQVRVLGFIEAYLKECGFPPNVREIGEGCGLRSTASVSHQLQRLEAFGRIKRTAGVARGIVVIGPDGES